MFRNYSKSYRYKLLKKNAQKSIELGVLDDISSATTLGKNTASTSSVASEFYSSNYNSMPDNFATSLTCNPIDFHTEESFDNIISVEDAIENNQENNSLNSFEVSNEFHQPYSSDESSDESQHDKVLNTTDFLAQWSLRNNITHTALSELLMWLKNNPDDLLYLPKDARTLLKTPSKSVYEIQGGGTFSYIGLTKKLMTIASTSSEKITHFLLDFGIDGLPIQKSTNLSFWPILCKIRNMNHVNVFPVAIYCGKEKPPLDEFLQKFVNELILLKNEGLDVCGKKIYIKIGVFCCDTPARAFVKNVKNHNGYHGCDKCFDRGIYCNRKMLFMKINAPLRTNENFLNETDINHHRGSTPLKSLGIGMISNFPTDYMHSVCLGVMRKLLFIWRDGHIVCKIRKLNIQEFDSYIKQIVSVWPSEFNRKPRSLKELERWKATELRQFLLYVGPVILKDLLPSIMYKHFLLLHLAVTILLSEALNKRYNDYAQKLLTNFVESSRNIYSQDFCIYNVHSLIHIAKDAKNFGDLNVISCFPFENYLGKLKQLLRKSNNPLQQITNRLCELENLSNEVLAVHYKTRFTTIGKPIAVDNESFEKLVGIIDKLEEYTFFRKVLYNQLVLSNRAGDNYVMLKNKEIIKVLYVGFTHLLKIVIGRKCHIKGSFFTYPTPSSLVSIYKIEVEARNDLVSFCMEDIQCKGVVLPHNNKQIFIPFVHSLDI